MSPLPLPRPSRNPSSGLPPRLHLLLFPLDTRSLLMNPTLPHRASEVTLSLPMTSPPLLRPCPRSSPRLLPRLLSRATRSLLMNRLLLPLSEATLSLPMNLLSPKLLLLGAFQRLFLHRPLLLPRHPPRRPRLRLRRRRNPLPPSLLMMRNPPRNPSLPPRSSLASRTLLVPLPITLWSRRSRPERSLFLFFSLPSPC